MRREKKKPDEEKRKRAFTVVIAITVVLSVCVGIVAVENESLSAGTTQNVNSAETGIQESFNGDVPFEIKVPQGKEKLKVPQKEGVNVSKDNKSKDMILPVISQNKTGLRVFSFTRNAISGKGGAKGNIMRNKPCDNTSGNNILMSSQNNALATESSGERDFMQKQVHNIGSLNAEAATSSPTTAASSIEEPSSNLT
jgi:hypothetical protein